VFGFKTPERDFDLQVMWGCALDPLDTSALGSNIMPAYWVRVR